MNLLVSPKNRRRLSGRGQSRSAPIRETRGLQAFWSWLCLILLLVFVNSCRSKTASLKEDLQLYVDKAILWTATEEQINKAIAGVRRDEFVHDDLITELLKPAVNIVWNHTQELEKYQPKAPPLQNVHREYIEAWRAHYQAMAGIVDAAEKKDYIQLAKANNDLIEAQRSLANANADLARLLHESGIQQETPEGEQAPSAPPQKSAL